ncbi:MAG: ribonuclease HII [Proteobacteria bacterium SW_6_67_9]|nr:MAG: ribonuclease HII [Proteobacteria bacterium SW_6_67_9]
MAGAAESDGPSAAELAPAGVDEAGRGPLAGPVTVAAVILGPGGAIPGVTDSKKLTRKRREAATERIRGEARAWALAWAEPDEVDRLNPIGASLAAMQRAVAALPEMPARVRVDGDRLPTLALPAEALIGGDARDPAIAAASILAKVARDAYMRELDARHPGYGFAAHKGYATPAHRAALERLGPCAAHRRSFAPVRAAADQGRLAFEGP